MVARGFDELRSELVVARLCAIEVVAVGLEDDEVPGGAAFFEVGEEFLVTLEGAPGVGVPRGGGRFFEGGDGGLLFGDGEIVDADEVRGAETPMIGEGAAGVDDGVGLEVEAAFVGFDEGPDGLG